MARKYFYTTALDLGTAGELEIKASFECPEYEMVEDIDIIAIEGHTAPFSVMLEEEIILMLVKLHEEDMIQEAYEADAEAHAEHLDRLDERKAELAGCR